MASIRQRGKSWLVEVRMCGRSAARSFPSRELAEQWAAREEEAASGMPMLRRALKDHRLSRTLSKRFLQAADKANYTEAEILEMAFPVDEACGIYFLVKRNTVIYIGQSVRLFHRLDKHRAEKRDFDSYAFIPCPREQLDELESVYITMLMPELNTSLPWRLKTPAQRSHARAAVESG